MNIMVYRLNRNMPEDLNYLYGGKKCLINVLYLTRFQNCLINGE